ncbi:flagellar biosynthetic protein FliR [uncultured Tyzzerella sp.]|uniref:flagellar biosynthetic protein FliR n=1 Tax=uncultured Tyzzerella sp. TaxID=2321398 RepID=UPI002942CD03|nr:flagellar biosynthetic protein FliR [uncultured Tyzzerella sp.]
MNLESSQILIDIFNNTDLYMLIFVRIIGFLIFIPVIGGNNGVAMVKIGLAMAISAIIFTSGNITEFAYINSIMGYFMLILKEFFVGAIIGYIVFFVFSSVYFTGHMIDQQMGYSMASVFDPVSNTQVPITGNLYYFSLCALFILNRGHHMLINAIFYSYKSLPIGKAYILGNNGLFFGIINIMIEFFKIGFLFALPIIGTILVMDIALGVLVRAVPKMNVFAVGMPLKVIAGLLALWVIMPVFSELYYRIYNVISELILNSIKVMMP